MTRRDTKRKPSALFWDIYSYFYDSLEDFYPYENLLVRTISKLKISNTSFILDLGCGTGNLEQVLLTQNEKLRITGVDWSSSMLRRAKRKLNKYKNVTLVKSDTINYLKNEMENKYSVVVMVNVVYTIHDREEMWRQIFRVLKPGGTLVFANPDRTGNSSIVKEHLSKHSGITLLKPRLIGVWLIDNILSMLGMSGNYNFVSEDLLYSELKQSNFALHKNLTERCYGGEKEGIDLIMIASKPGSMI